MDFKDMSKEDSEDLRAIGDAIQRIHSVLDSEQQQALRALVVTVWELSKKNGPATAVVDELLSERKITEWFAIFNKQPGTKQSYGEKLPLKVAIPSDDVPGDGTGKFGDDGANTNPAHSQNSQLAQALPPAHDNPQADVPGQGGNRDNVMPKDGDVGADRKNLKRVLPLQDAATAGMAAERPGSGRLLRPRKQPAAEASDQDLQPIAKGGRKRKAESEEGNSTTKKAKADAQNIAGAKTIKFESKEPGLRSVQRVCALGSHNSHLSLGPSWTRWQVVKAWNQFAAGPVNSLAAEKCDSVIRLMWTHCIDGINSNVAQHVELYGTAKDKVAAIAETQQLLDTVSGASLSSTVPVEARKFVRSAASFRLDALKKESLGGLANLQGDYHLLESLRWFRELEKQYKSPGPLQAWVKKSTPEYRASRGRLEAAISLQLGFVWDPKDKQRAGLLDRLLEPLGGAPALLLFSPNIKLSAQMAQKVGQTEVDVLVQFMKDKLQPLRDLVAILEPCLWSALCDSNFGADATVELDVTVLAQRLRAGGFGKVADAVENGVDASSDEDEDASDSGDETESERLDHRRDSGQELIERGIQALVIEQGDGGEITGTRSVEKDAEDETSIIDSESSSLSSIPDDDNMDESTDQEASHDQSRDGEDDTEMSRGTPNGSDDGRSNDDDDGMQWEEEDHGETPDDADEATTPTGVVNRSANPLCDIDSLGYQRDEHAFEEQLCPEFGAVDSVGQDDRESSREPSPASVVFR